MIVLPHRKSSRQTDPLVAAQSVESRPAPSSTSRASAATIPVPRIEASTSAPKFVRELLNGRARSVEYFFRVAMLTMTFSLLLPAAVTPAAPGCTSVMGERILGSDLARVYPAFAALPADLTVGYTPQPGLRRIMTVEQLSRIAHEYGIPEETWTAACFMSPLVPIADAEIEQAMRSALTIDGVQITVQDLMPRVGPPGKLVFQAMGLQPPRAGESVSVWHGAVVYGANRRYPLTARVRVIETSTRVVATGSLVVGQPIPEDKVRVEKVEGFPPVLVAAKSVKEVAGKLPRRTIAAGSVVLASDLALPPDIIKGERVQVEVRNGSARLMLDAQAQAAGRSGDMIPVRNLQSGRNFLARIEGKGRVAVNLKGNTP